MVNIRFIQATSTALIITLFVVLSGCKPSTSKVAIMRAQKATQDSIEYIQAQNTLTYSDSLLQTLLPIADELLKKFRYIKDERYEDQGQYVHKLLNTERNTSRNFIQSYISDAYQVVLKSYYYGSRSIHQQSIQLSCADMLIKKEGVNHAFQAEGWHEIMTVEGDDALELLRYISSHTQERILVSIKGDFSQTYYLQQAEKEALADTYHLGIVMRDIHQLERAIRISNLQIEKYQRRQDKRSQESELNKQL
jgi:hypothetical protein